MATSQHAWTPADLIPPHLILRDVLDEPTLEAFLDYACAREADFTPSGFARRGDSFIDATVRKSLQLRGLGGFESLLRSLVYDRAGELMARLRMSPVEISTSFDTQLVAHGDGAFFKRHIDTMTNDRSRRRVRVLSGVFYFHRRPRAFSGGELRLFDLADRDRFIDIEPTHNTLVLFPAWAPHEVRPVSCPSGRFADARFAVNCWIHARSPTHNRAPA
jgi:SM-20-related protein